MEKFRGLSLRSASTKILFIVVAFVVLLGVYWVLNTFDKPVDTDVTDDPPVDPDPQPDPDPEPETGDIFWESLLGPPGGAVPFLVQNPGGENELYAGTFPGLFVSHDHGDSFTMVFNASLGEISSLAIYDNKLYFTARDAYVLDPALDELKYIRDNTSFLWIHGDRLYASQVILQGVYPEIVLEYMDLDSSNPSWTSLPSLNPIMDTITSPYRVPKKPFYPEIMVSNLIETQDGVIVILGFNDEQGEYEFLVNQPVLYSETNASWSTLDPEIDEELRVTKIVQDPEDPQHLVMVLRTGKTGEQEKRPLKDLIKESHDGGYTWVNYTTVEEPKTYYLKDVDFVNGSIYLHRVSDYIVRLSGTNHDEVELFSMASIGSTNQVLWLGELIFDVNNSDVVYGLPDIEVGHTGLVRSSDGLKTWQLIGDGIPSSQVSNVGVHLVNGDIIVTSSNIGHFPHITRDGGETWNRINGVANMGDELAFDPHNPDHMILITESSAIFESWDGGYTWNTTSKNFSTARISDIEVANNESVIASLFGIGISSFKGIDEVDYLIKVGEINHNWKHMYASSDYAYDLELDPNDNNILYSTYSPKLFENHSSLWRYDTDQEENSGWSEILRVNNSTGMTSVKVDRNNSSKIYAASVGQRGIMHISIDKGKTWDHLAPSLSFSSIHTMAADSNTDGLVYAAPWGGGLFRSANHGENWDELQCPTISVSSILLDPSNSDHIVIGDRLAPMIYESFNRGETWETLVSLDSDAFYRVSSMVFAHDTLYFSMFNRIEGITGLYTEEPMSGTTFRLTPEGLEEVTGEMSRAALSFLLHEGDLHAVSHIQGVYRLGLDWMDISNELPDLGFSSMTIGPDGVLFLSGGCDIGLHGETRVGDEYLINNIYRSYDYGESWHPMLEDTPMNSSIKALIFPNEDPDFMVAGTGNGVYTSLDGGANWNSENYGLDFRNIGCMSMHGNTVYAGTLGGGVYRGLLNGEGHINWSQSQGPYPELYNIQLQIDPEDSEVIYATSYPGGVFKTIDAGKTWDECNFALPSFRVKDPQIQGYYSLEIGPSNSNILYLGLFHGGVYKSWNGGAVWQPLYGENHASYTLMNSGVKQVKVNPAAPNEVYVASDAGVFKSEDGGSTWGPMNYGLDTLDIQTIKITRNGTLLAGTNGYGVYLLDRDTHSWVHMGKPIGVGIWAPWERRLYQYSALLFDPDVPGRIYYGSFPSGFFISEDDADTWQCSSIGLGNDGLFSLTYHPEDHQTLFAGTYNGVWKSTDGGQTWADSSNGMPSEQWPFTVAIDAENPDIMYVTTKNGQNKGFMNRNTFAGVVMKSLDGGENWFKIMNGLKNMSEYYSLIIHPNDPQTLFMSSTYGVYLSQDAGHSWNPMNEGIPIEYHMMRDNVASNLKLTPDNKNLILGIVNYGVWKADILGLLLP